MGQEDFIWGPKNPETGGGANGADTATWQQRISDLESGAPMSIYGYSHAELFKASLTAFGLSLAAYFGMQS